ncbi:MAG: GatB/YqeY domain-containing protein [Actinomycetota bacterium]|nr:GatB/YqeY domain-containing protein [Actinomycetota bacterium]
MPLVDKVKEDLAAAMRAGERDRVGRLRLVLSELQKAAKDGNDDEVGVLRRERKRRLDAAAQFRDAGRDELAANEEAEAELIGGYLPAELPDEELNALVAEAVAEAGASSPKDMGNVMKLVMPRVGGRADGRRVSAAVKEILT